MDTEEIIRLALQIERSGADRSYGDVLTLLGDLDKFHITAEQLETTDVVKVLYRLLRSCSDDGVKKTVKSLLSRWKRRFSSQTCGETHTGLSRRVSPPGEAEDGGRSRRQDSHAGSGCDLTAAEVRSRCVELLLAALGPDLPDLPDLPDHDKAAELAAGIEQRLHQLHPSSQVKYKACVRSKVANLRNPKNRHLREGLLSGSLAPDAFARMSVEEMASPELRRLREEYSSRAVSERQLPQGVEGTPTHKIRCKKCGGTDCKVTQVSRGALFLPAWVRQSGPDEDAMTFVTCSGCGQQWYHSAWVCL